MNINTQNANYAKQWISQIPGIDSKYLELENAIAELASAETLTQWQPLFSLSVYSWCIEENASHPSLDGETEPVISKSDLDTIRLIAITNIPKLKQLITELLKVLESGSYDEEMSQLLFHAKLAIGHLYITTGELLKGINALTDAIETNYNAEYQREHSEGNIIRKWEINRLGHNVPFTPDIALGKLLATYRAERWYLFANNYLPILILKIRATEANPSEWVFSKIEDYLVLWLLQINNIKREGHWNNVNKVLLQVADMIQSGTKDFDKICLNDWKPKEQWMGLLYVLSVIPLFCMDEDVGESTPATPDECRINSANYWAWQFGQIMAFLWNTEGPEFIRTIINMESITKIDIMTHRLTLLSLIAECDEKKDWNTARDLYLIGWRITAKAHINQLSREGPDLALYWAMRVGLAEGFMNPIQLLEGVKVNKYNLPDHKIVVEKSIRDVNLGWAEFDEKIKLHKEDFKKEFRSQYGDWIDSLDNPDALFNAEFYYTTKQDSWSSIIIEYSGCLEREISGKLIRPIKKYLASYNLFDDKDFFLGININRPEFGGIIQVLEWLTNHPLGKNFRSRLEEEGINLIRLLVNNLNEIRLIRNNAAHGNKVTRDQATQIRQIIIGTPENPGLLKRLNQLKIREET